MSTYDLLAAWTVLSVPATVILLVTVRMQVKEIARLRKQAAPPADTRQPVAASETDDPTTEQRALEPGGAQSDLLDDTHQFRALTPSDDFPDQDQLTDPHTRGPQAVSVFEKLRSRR
jgi:hypothetical protein